MRITGVAFTAYTFKLTFTGELMLRNSLEDYLILHAGVDRSKLADNTLTMADLGLDSLGVVEMLFEVEEKYGFRLEDVAQYGAMTFAQVVANLERQVELNGIHVESKLQGANVAELTDQAEDPVQQAARHAIGPA